MAATSVFERREPRPRRATRRATRATPRVGVGLALLLVIGSGLWAQAVVSGPAAKVDPRIYGELRERGSTCVCVELGHADVEGASLVARSGAFRRAQRAFLDSLPAGSFRLRHRYHYSPSIVLEVEGSEVLERLERSPHVRRVLPDVRGRGGLLESREVIGADQVHELGFLGEGQVLAVVDSGVDSNHPDLADAIVHQYHYLDQGADSGEGAEDDNGHGTHISGIIASRGVVGPLGVAPESGIVAIKVLDRGNNGWFSDWTAGVEHVTRLHLEDNGVEVSAINLSLISFDRFTEVCDDEFPALHLAIEAAREAGIIAFACSGNDGLPNALNIPGCYSSTVSVGSVPDDAPDRVSSFSNRGPLLDLLAPGETITSSDPNGETRERRGCSFATPHVVATAGLLREVDPGLDPAALHELLRAYGVPVFDALSRRTYPLIDAHASVIAAQRRVEGDPFHRGDVNVDGDLNLVDPVFLLNFLFGGGGRPECLESSDANGDSRIDVADGIYLLQFLVGGGAPPPHPGPPGFECGTDTVSGLGCARYEACTDVD